MQILQRAPPEFRSFALKKVFFLQKQEKLTHSLTFKIGDITLHHIIKQWTFFQCAFNLWLI